MYNEQCIASEPDQRRFEINEFKNKIYNPVKAF